MLWITTVLLVALAQRGSSFFVTWMTTPDILVEAVKSTNSTVWKEIKKVLSEKLERNYRLRNCGFDPLFEQAWVAIVDYGVVADEPTQQVIVIEATLPFNEKQPYKPKFYFPFGTTQESSDSDISFWEIISTMQITRDGYESVRYAVRSEIDEGMPLKTWIYGDIDTDGAKNLRSYLATEAGHKEILKMLPTFTTPASSSALNIAYAYGRIHGFKKHFLIYQGETGLDNAREKLFNILVAMNEFDDVGESESRFEVLNFGATHHLSEHGYAYDIVEAKLEGDLNDAYAHMLSLPYVVWKLPGCMLVRGSPEELLAGATFFDMMKKWNTNEQRKQFLEREYLNNSNYKTQGLNSLALTRMGIAHNLPKNALKLYKNAHTCYAWSATVGGVDGFIFALGNQKQEIQAFLPVENVDLFKTIGDVSIAGKPMFWLW